MPKYKILIAQFPGNHTTHQDVANYAADLQVRLIQHPDFGPGNVARWHIIDTPITMGRNRALAFAEDNGFDYVIMIDSDMAPDLPIEGSKPFFDSSWEFIKNHHGPCVIAAPYCGPPEDEQVYVFKFMPTVTGSANPNFKITNIDRYEAAVCTGIQSVAALATGLMLIDMRAVKLLPHPRFYYEFKDERETHKKATEDVAFSRDLYMLGVPLYVNWDAWAGHHKLKLVIKPQRVTRDFVPDVLIKESLQLSTDALKINANAAFKDLPETEKEIGKKILDKVFSGYPTIFKDKAKKPQIEVVEDKPKTTALESKPIPVLVKSGTLDSAGEMDFNDKFSPVAVKGSSHLGVKPGVLIPADLSAMEIIQNKKPKSYSVDSENTVEYFSYEKIVPPESNEVNPEEDPINEVL